MHPMFQRPAVQALLESVRRRTPEEEARAKAQIRKRARRKQPGNGVLYVDRIARTAAERLGKPAAAKGFAAQLAAAVAEGKLRTVDLSTDLYEKSSYIDPFDRCARWADAVAWFKEVHGKDVGDSVQAPEPVPTPAGNPPAQREKPVKPSKLIAMFEDRWPSVRDDINNAYRNKSDGMAAAARAQGRPGWYPTKAWTWAMENDKTTEECGTSPGYDLQKVRLTGKK